MNTELAPNDIKKAMLAHSISAFPGGGRCRKAADEAPNKI